MRYGHSVGKTVGWTAADESVPEVTLCAYNTVVPSMSVSIRRPCVKVFHIQNGSIHSTELQVIKTLILCLWYSHESAT